MNRAFLLHCASTSIDAAAMPQLVEIDDASVWQLLKGKGQ